MDRRRGIDGHDLQLLKEQYVQMRTDMKQGYGKHSFEKGLSKKRLQRECVTVLNEKCKKINGYFEDKGVLKGIEKVILKKFSRGRYSDVVKELGKASYDQLSEIHLVLKLYVFQND